jgi:hypothetical protein
MMAFELRGPATTVLIDDAGEELFELPSRYGETASQLPQIHARFYQASAIYPAVIPQLRDELQRLQKRREGELVPVLRRERKVFSKDKAVEARTLQALLHQDALYLLLERLLQLCDECLATGATIECVGD